MMPVDNKKVSLASLRSLSGISTTSLEDEDSTELGNYDERKWRLSHLKSQFESLELHKLYSIYTDKINHGYFSLFLILQGILSLTHIVLILTTDRYEADLIVVIPDLILYLLVFVSCILGLYLVDKVVERYKKLQYVSMTAFAILFFVNAFVPYYHSVREGLGNYRTAYSSLLILSCYVFFCIHDLLVSFIMGVFVSTFYIMTLILTTYSGSDILWQRILSEVFYVIVINGLGIYIRYMNEIVIRRSFLDRRDCITSTFQLRHEKEQGEQLMSSIIPSDLMRKVLDNHLEAARYYLQTKKYLEKNPFENALITECDDVTILFADIVHYTEMTMKLNITELLETLNDLFGWFDDASEKLKVIRIKFLGDCYYCVAGLPPDPAPNHAEACVDLGLAMISIISNVRRKRNLNINMRIGVHTGKIFSGIIGAVKYQFDIWSKDVDIANKMESKGTAGKVHITNKTKALLQKPYIIQPQDKEETIQQFKQYNLETFLVSPTENEENRIQIILESNGSPVIPPRPSLYKKQKKGQSNGTILLTQLQNSSIQECDHQNSTRVTTNDSNASPSISSTDENGNMNDRSIKRRISNSPYRSSRTMDDRRSTADIKRRTAFMNNNIKRYAERTTAVNKEMEKTIADVSYSKYEQYVKRRDINSVFLCFIHRKIELGYVTLPDPLFKYYLLSAAALIFFVYIIQNLTLSHWSWSSWPFLATEGLIIFVFIPLTWTHFFWNRYQANIIDDPPRNKIIIFLCKSSKFITKQFLARLAMFTVIYILFGVCVLMELFQCEAEDQEGNFFGEKRTLIPMFSNLTSIRYNEYCIVPWHMTETCVLAVIMTFLFLRTFIWIKLFFSFITVFIYGYFILGFSKTFYEGSETFNYGLQPQISHIMAVVFFAITLHCIDRQTDYINRMDHLSNLQLKIEQEEANILQIVNKNLLEYILPKHVAKLYLDIRREDMKELYYEYHKDVAVMFASIIVEDDLQDIIGDKQFLIRMNDYIKAFDTLINRKEFLAVEKIKVAKWTYMAACGLIPGGNSLEVERHVTSTTLQTLLSFASNMFKQLQKANKIIESQLRIGICHGPIVAGVVGSKKPLYDIWGNAVNMASRMDSTGVPNCIQVMEDTAAVITNLGYICDYRDRIYVKGADDLVNTYFVRLDEHFDLVKNITEISDDCD